MVFLTPCRPSSRGTSSSGAPSSSLPVAHGGRRSLCWGLCWGPPSGSIPSGARAVRGWLKELRTSSGIQLTGSRGGRQRVLGMALGWAWRPGIKGERKELEVEGTDLEWRGQKRQVRGSRHTPTADVKICHALLCGNMRVLGERNVPGSVGCPDLVSTVLTSCNKLSRTAVKARTTREDLPLSYSCITEPSDQMFYTRGQE